MKALDTNVLIRFLVKDNAHQAQIVYRLFKKAEAEKNVFWVSLVVFIEMIWVLDADYHISRKEILASFNELLSMPILKFEAQPAIVRFIFLASKTTVELSDVLIACAAKLSGCDRVLTFDKKASKFEFFESLK